MVDEGGQMTFGFITDNSADVVISQITNVANATDRLVQANQQLINQYNTQRSTIQQTNTAMQQTVGGLTQATTLTENLAGSNQRLTGSLANVQTNLDKANTGWRTHFTNLAQNVSQIGFAAAALTGLIFSFTQLQRAHLLVERSNLAVETAQLRVTTATNALNKAIAEHGQGSTEAATANQKLEVAQKRLDITTQRAEFSQTRYSQTIIQFATQFVPTAVGVAAGLIQTFDILSASTRAAAIATIFFGSALRTALTLTGVGIAITAISLLISSFGQKTKETSGDLTDFGDETTQTFDETATNIADSTTKIQDSVVSMADAVKAARDTIKQGAEGVATDLDEIKKNIIKSLTIKKEELPEVNIFSLPNLTPEKKKELFATGTLPTTTGTSVTGGTSTARQPTVTPHFATIGPNLPSIPAGTATTQAPNLELNAKNLEAVAQATVKVDTANKATSKSEQTLTQLFTAGNDAYIQTVDAGNKLINSLGITTQRSDEQAVSMQGLVNQLKQLSVQGKAGTKEFQDIKDQIVALGLEILTGTTDIESMAKAFEEMNQTPTSKNIQDITKDFVGLAKEQDKQLDFEKQHAQDVKNTNDALKQNNDIAKQLPVSLGKLVGVEQQHSLTMRQKSGIITAYDQELINQEYMEKQVATAVTNANVVQGQSKEVIAAIAAQSTDLVSKLEDQATQTQASTLLWNNMSDSMQEIIFGYQEATLASIDMTRALTNNVYQQFLMNQGEIEGKLAVQQWVDSLVQATAAEETQKLMTEAVVETYMKIPPALDLTIKDLQALQEEYVRTGDNAATMDDLQNKAFKSSRDALSKLVDAAVQGGKQWKDAWKDLDKKFIPKGELGEVKGFIKDLGDMKTAVSDLDVPLATFMGLLANGKIDAAENSKWTKQLTEGMRGLRDSLGQIVGMDVARTIFDPLIKFKKDGLTQDEVQIWAAVANEYERLSNLPGVWTDERTRQLQAFTNKLLENKSAADDTTVSYDNLSDAADKLGKKIITFPGSGLQTLSNKKGKLGKHSIAGGVDAAITAALGLAQNRDPRFGEEQTGTPDPTGEIDKMAQQIAKSLTSVQDAAKTMAAQVSNSMSIMVKNVRPHVITLQTYFGTTIPDAAGLAALSIAQFMQLGSNGMALLIKNIRPHVITLQTYFAKTIVQAVNQASMSLLAFSLLAKSILGGGKAGGGGKDGLQNVDFGIGGPTGDFNIFSKDLGLLGAVGGGGGGGGGGGSNLGLGSERNTARLIPQSAGGKGKGGGGLVGQLVTSFGLVAMAAVETNKIVQKEFSAMFVALQGMFLGIAKEWSKDMNSMGKNAASGSKQVQKEFSTMWEFSTKVFADLVDTWSQNMADMAQNARDGAKGVDNEFAKMEKKAESVFDKLVKSWSQAMADMGNNARDGAKAVNRELAKIKDVDVKVTATLTGSGANFIHGIGAIHLLAGGGIIDKAEAGKIYTTNGPQMVLIGDNPGGKEIHAMIPMNNPTPTLKNLQKVLASKGIASSGGNVSSGRDEGGEKTEIINLNIDGEKLMTWIRRKILRNRMGG